VLPCEGAQARVCVTSHASSTLQASECASRAGAQSAACIRTSLLSQQMTCMRTPRLQSREPTSGYPPAAPAPSWRPRGPPRWPCRPPSCRAARPPWPCRPRSWTPGPQPAGRAERDQEEFCMHKQQEGHARAQKQRGACTPHALPTHELRQRRQPASTAREGQPGTHASRRPTGARAAGRAPGSRPPFAGRACGSALAALRAASCVISVARCAAGSMSGAIDAAACSVARATRSALSGAWSASSFTAPTAICARAPGR